ncbi:hypothetical protein EalM132_00187 [Exiguobacterium phage vB_EalM-132]|nr:hypothetical protein EalM132_00017 [Exiguobacterium phage vB_EalM-132]AYP68699.1 hypothetical protein EalM132_00187 [Exiguobacterium phage vB_EalM-132]
MAKKAKERTINKAFVEKYLAEHNGFPEKNELSKDELKKFYKHLTDAQLDEWLEIEGLEYTETENDAINRMRKCMAILYNRFPRETKPKEKSKYAEYDTEQLLKMAEDNNIEIEQTDNPAILRMRAIMALRDKKVIG